MLSYNKNKTLIIHFLFWVVYYIFFGIIWAKNGNYKDSFFLEFILLPIRIFCVYFTVLFLLPQFLLKKKFVKFFGFYLVLLLLASVLQNVFIQFFMDNTERFDIGAVVNLSALLRASILINSTVLFVLSVYILKHYFDERTKNELLSKNKPESKVVILKSNKRNYHIEEKNIIRVEGLGNYVTYHLTDGSSIVVYSVLKDVLTILSDDFVRVHKSHIVNKTLIKSYSKDNIELTNNDLIPIGNSVNLDLGLLSSS